VFEPKLQNETTQQMGLTDNEIEFVDTRTIKLEDILSEIKHRLDEEKKTTEVKPKKSNSPLK
jgi:hypothetical protein